MRKDPTSIQAAPIPGPSYDPMDRIIEDLENAQSFLSCVKEHPSDLEYVEKHFSKILALQRTISQTLDQLSEEPYSYSASRLALLKRENEAIFSYLEGAIGATNPLQLQKLRKFIHVCEKQISQF